MNGPRPAHAAFGKLDLGQVSPRGWLAETLRRQVDGLTGHIAESGYPFDTCLWAGDKMEGSPTAWWPYEQTAYYLDAAARVGRLTGDEGLLAVVRRNLAWVDDHVLPSGRFATVLTERWRHWPYASFARVAMAEFEATGDRRLVDLLHRHYLTFAPADFADVLELANVEVLLWLHGLTGDQRLVDLAEAAYRLFLDDPALREWFGCDLDFAGGAPPTTHGVVYLELLKIPALLYATTGKGEYLAAAQNGARTMEAASLLVSGLPSSTEHFEDRGETCGHETCNTAVLPYTYGHLLRATGQAGYGDRIERAVFNAGFGSITKDFRAHQYFSSPNQPVVEADSNPYGHHPARLAYQKAHDVQCCTGNVNRFVPYYVEQQWLASPDGLVAALYGPCVVTAPVGPQRIPVTIAEDTAYPFDDTVRFRLELEQPTRFSLAFRVPAWCAAATLELNGTAVDGPLAAGTFFRLEREFRGGDTLLLRLPKAVVRSEWPNRGTAFEYGPLVFSWPAPAGAAWNWAIEPGEPQLVVAEPSGYPWLPEAAPYRLRVAARRLPGWKLVRKTDPRHGRPVTVCPGFPLHRKTKGDPVTLTLVPYGCTTARLTVFP